MSTDRPFAPVRAATYEAADPEGPRLRNSIEPEPVAWHVAVHAAAALLDERFGPPGSAADPAITDMARDLAARLCAYSEIVEVVEQTRLHEPASPYGSSHPAWPLPEGSSSPNLSPTRSSTGPERTSSESTGSEHISSERTSSERTSSESTGS